MLRNTRQAKILEIIAAKEIETQEELCAELQAENLMVTQATISRDIRDLRLFKVAGVTKKYRYAYINEGESDISPKLKTLFHNCVLSIRAAKNLIIVKTLPGNGANAGNVIDKLNYDSVVGSVAGDDTVLIVCETDEGAELVVKKLGDFIN